MHSDASKDSEWCTVGHLLKACGDDTSEVAVGPVMPVHPTYLALAQHPDSLQHPRHSCACILPDEGDLSP